MKYRVEIIEYLARTFTVDAPSEEEAVSEIKKRYADADIVLGCDDFLECEIKILEE